VTEELFSTDAYASSCEATVVEHREHGVVLDRTVFYARSGGQPGDTGLLRWEDGQVRVTETVKQAGEILHELEGAPPPLRGAVTAEIDWDRRHTLMRTHTALHALSGIVSRDYGAMITLMGLGIALFPKYLVWVMVAYTVVNAAFLTAAIAAASASTIRPGGS